MDSSDMALLYPRASAKVVREVPPNGRRRGQRRGQVRSRRGGRVSPNISLEEARALAIEHARDNTEFYGSRYAKRQLSWEVDSADEGEDYYDIRLSYRPAERFRGEPGTEQFTISKTGVIELRQLLSEPREKRGMLSRLIIIFRRLLTIPLGLLLLVELLLALVALQISATFLDPDFYPKELRKANIYEFVLVDVATSALDEARLVDAATLTVQLDENPLVTLGLPTQELVTSLNKAIPPSYVQSIVEQVFDELGRYIAGEQDEFQVTIQAGDQAVIMVEEIKSLLRKADAYDLMFDELITPAIEKAVAQELPFSVNLTSERLGQSARRIAPPEWVQAQVETALDEITPYLIGDRDTFEIRAELSDRAEIALEEMKILLREADAYDLLYGEVIEPRVEEFLGTSIELPLGITITIEEVNQALRQVAPLEWVQQEAERVIDQATPYLTGKDDGLLVDISLVDNKRQARDIIVDTVTEKVTQAAAELPTCTASQMLSQVISQGALTLPQCLPPDIQPEQLAGLMRASVAEAVDASVLGSIPDVITFTDANLRQALLLAESEDTLGLVDDVRMVIGDGWRYADFDLRQDILEQWGEDGLEQLDDARDFLGDGWTYTQEDFREDLAQAGDESTLDEFDRGRTWLNRAQTYRLLIFVPILLSLVSIGFLGGRRWTSRFAWASAFLMVTAAIIFVLSWPVYDAFGKDALDDERETAISKIDFGDDFETTQRLVTDKGFDVFRTVADDFASGIAVKSLVVFIIGLIGLVVSLRWRNVVGLASRIRR